jgi:hypothetical protein
VSSPRSRKFLQYDVDPACGKLVGKTNGTVSSGTIGICADRYALDVTRHPVG